MTKVKIKKVVSQQLDEFFDSYVLVGRVAGRRSVVIVAQVQSVRDHLKLIGTVRRLMGADVFDQA